MCEVGLYGLGNRSIFSSNATQIVYIQHVSLGCRQPAMAGRRSTITARKYGNSEIACLRDASAFLRRLGSFRICRSNGSIRESTGITHHLHRSERHTHTRALRRWRRSRRSARQPKSLVLHLGWRANVAEACRPGMGAARRACTPWFQAWLKDPPRLTRMRHRARASGRVCPAARPRD